MTDRRRKTGDGVIWSVQIRLVSRGSPQQETNAGHLQFLECMETKKIWKRYLTYNARRQWRAVTGRGSLAAVNVNRVTSLRRRGTRSKKTSPTTSLSSNTRSLR